MRNVWFLPPINSSISTYGSYTGAALMFRCCRRNSGCSRSIRHMDARLVTENRPPGCGPVSRSSKVSKPSSRVCNRASTCSHTATLAWPLYQLHSPPDSVPELQHGSSPRARWLKHRAPHAALFPLYAPCWRTLHRQKQHH